MVPSMTRKRPALVEGLTAGVERAGFPVLGRGIGDGLLQISEWPKKGVFAVPQMCPWRACPPQTYVSKPSLKQHFSASHPWMSDSLRAWLADRAYREAYEQAMDGEGRAV